MVTTAMERLGSKELEYRGKRAMDSLGSCRICPRNCQVNRLNGEVGFCRIGRLTVVASYNLHFGEEDVLVGRDGSGTIFFSGCNLGCVFCQNWDISHTREGEQETKVGLAKIMIQLQDMGAENINVVTPTHVTPQILEALPIARDMGLTLPLVYNCGGYESVETLQLLDGIVDIYMPDAKFWDSAAAKKYCLAEDYPERARQAIVEMHRQVGDLKVNDQGVAVSGLLVRHLVMPGGLAGTREWMEFLAKEISPNTYVNIMNQYRPCGEADRFPELLDRVSGDEYEQALEMARRAGLTRLDDGGKNKAEKVLRRLLGG